MSSSWAGKAAARNRAYDEEAARKRDEEARRHRENRRHREQIERVGGKATRRERRERYELEYDRADPEPDVRAPERIGGESFIVHKAEPQTKDEEQAWARLKVVGS